jgi:hypothetical protein
MAKRKAKSPTHSKAYLTFENVVRRAFHLLTLEHQMSNIQSSVPTTNRLDLSDLSRAAIILGVAAMDAYFTDIFTEKLVTFLKSKKNATKLAALLQDAGLTTVVALELLTMERPYRRIRTLIETHLEVYTTQKTHKIDLLFIAFNLKDFCKNVEAMSNRKNLLTSIRTLVDRRHSIAHGGDLNSYGKLQHIDREKIRRKIRDVVLFVATSEKLIAKAIA